MVRKMSEIEDLYKQIDTYRTELLDEDRTITELRKSLTSAHKLMTETYDEQAATIAHLRAENVRLVAELTELVGSVNVLKSLLSDGEYSICRTDHEKMGLGDQMIVEGAIERIDKALVSHHKEEGEDSDQAYYRHD